MKNLITLLDQKSNVDEYLITETKTSSTELFFIKDELQMNRGKDVEHITVTVYRNFEEDGKKFKGSSKTKLSPTMTLDEMEALIDIAALAASFVKNEYYSLQVPSDGYAPSIPSKFSDGDVIKSISELVKDVYSQNQETSSFINSVEFFIDRIETRLINSNGVDISQSNFKGLIELIIEATGEKESIELFDMLYFSDHISDDIKDAVKQSLKFATLRANAIPMPNVENIPVILNGAATQEFWDYYKFCASGGSKYNRLHENNVGDNVQGDNVQGSKVTITLAPTLPNSTTSSYYDTEGTFLKEVTIIKDGEIKAIVAGKRYSDYLNIPTTGDIRNTVVEGGIYSEAELKDGPYLELLKFSAFQMNPMTGNFGGEFRLGIYFDGTTKTPVTLGSIAADIKDVQENMQLSKELVKDNNFIGPKFIKLYDVRIAGN